MKLTLSSFWRSSSAWRVRNALHLKGLAWSYRAVDLGAGEQWRPESGAVVSPLHQVPVLTVEEPGLPPRHLVQSVAIVEWLDERFPDPPLLPPDLYGRARVRALVEHVNSGTQPVQNAIVLKRLREKVPGWDLEWARLFIGEGLAALERAVNDGQAGRFAHGDAPGLADCYLVPQLYNGRRFGVDLAPFPTLRRIEEHCLALAPFRDAHPDMQPDAPPPERRTP